MTLRHMRHAQEDCQLTAKPPSSGLPHQLPCPDSWGHFPQIESVESSTSNGETQQRGLSWKTDSRPWEQVFKAYPLKPSTHMPSHVWLFVAPWTVCSPLEFFRQEYWGGLLFPPQGDLLDPGIEPTSPALTGGFFTTVPPEKPKVVNRTHQTLKAAGSWQKEHLNIWALPITTRSSHQTCSF